MRPALAIATLFLSTLAAVAAGQSWQAAPELVIQSGHNDQVSLAVSHDGSLMASIGNERAILLWNLHTHRIVRRIGEIDAVASLEFSPDDRWLAVGASTRFLGGSSRYTTSFVWDVRTGRRQVLLKGAFGELAFTPDGKIISGSKEGRRLELFDPKSGLSVRDLGAIDMSLSLQVSHDGRWLFCDCGKKVNATQVRRLDDGAVVRAFADDDPGWRTAPDGSLLAL
jgi:WD40 repeat protein